MKTFYGFTFNALVKLMFISRAIISDYGRCAIFSAPTWSPTFPFPVLQNFTVSFLLSYWVQLTRNIRKQLYCILRVVFTSLL